MADTYTCLRFHFVFNTKNRFPFIDTPVEAALHKFIGQLAVDIEVKLLVIGGVADHVHMLAALPPTMSVSAFIKRIKGASSVWLKNNFPAYGGFSWQEGYSAFTVSSSMMETTLCYILNQHEHHKTQTPEHELCEFIKKHETDDAKLVREH